MPSRNNSIPSNTQQNDRQQLQFLQSSSSSSTKINFAPARRETESRSQLLTPIRNLWLSNLMKRNGDNTCTAGSFDAATTTTTTKSSWSSSSSLARCVSSCVRSQKCVQDCMSHDLVCPWAAQVAARTTRQTMTKVLHQSQVFVTGKAPQFTEVPVTDIVSVGELLGEGGFSQVLKCTVELPVVPDDNKNNKTWMPYSSTTATLSSSPAPCSAIQSNPNHKNNSSSNNNNNHHGKTNKPRKRKKEVAMKFLSRQAMIDPHHFKHGAADLAVEAYFLQTLQHENIIQLHGIAAGSIPDNILLGAESVHLAPPHNAGFFLLLDCLQETLEQKIQNWRQEETRRYVLTHPVGSGNPPQNMSNHSYYNIYSGGGGGGGGGNVGGANSSSSSTSFLLEYRQTKLVQLLERLQIAVQIAKALEYLHSMNIMFRDLKPDNIGFDQHGVVKLFDFGLVKEVKQPQWSSSSHHSNQSGTKQRQQQQQGPTYQLTGHTGSRRYMAPEVAQGSRSYDLTVDVYSFGILLWELCSATKPFYGYSTNKHMQRVVVRGERPTMDVLHTQHWPLALQTLMKHCWSTSPLQRPCFSQIVAILERTRTYCGSTNHNKNNKKNNNEDNNNNNEDTSSTTITAGGGGGGNTNFTQDHYQWARDSSPEEINLLLGLQQPRRRSSAQQLRDQQLLQLQKNKYSKSSGNMYDSDGGEDDDQCSANTSFMGWRGRHRRQRRRRSHRRGLSLPRWFALSWTSSSSSPPPPRPSRNHHPLDDPNTVDEADDDRMVIDDDDATYKRGRRRRQVPQHHQIESLCSQSTMDSGAGSSGLTKKKKKTKPHHQQQQQQQRGRATTRDYDGGGRRSKSLGDNTTNSSIGGGFSLSSWRPRNFWRRRHNNNRNNNNNNNNRPREIMVATAAAASTTAAPMPMTQAATVPSIPMVVSGSAVQILPESTRPPSPQNEPTYQGADRRINDENDQGILSVPTTICYVRDDTSYDFAPTITSSGGITFGSTGVNNNDRNGYEDDDDSFQSACMGSDQEWEVNHSWSIITQVFSVFGWLRYKTIVPVTAAADTNTVPFATNAREEQQQHPQYQLPWWTWTTNLVAEALLLVVAAIILAILIAVLNSTGIAATLTGGKQDGVLQLLQATFTCGT